ncbi:fibronectin type III domain-containing protein [Actinoplanes sp. NPDC023801]|uniref:fibronectin type III domain-containing protein n=1 Tax=Actinoplanes sp. NPDC023801 TaxID=3154595 RepID=UPI0033C6C229
MPLKPSPGPIVRLNGRIDVQWTAPADGGSVITGYTVTVQPGGRTIAVPGDTTVTSITGLANGTAYTIGVTATNAAGTSEPTTFAATTPVATRAPAAPTDVRAAVTEQGKVRVDWTPPQDFGTSTVTSYTVRATPGTVTATTTGTSAVLTGLTATTNYTFAVTATNAAGTGVASTATQPVLPKLAFKDAFTVFTTEQAAQIRTVHQDGTLIFDGDDAPAYAGDLIVVPPTPVAERGMLRRVTDVSTSGGLTALSTVEAGLDEIYTDGSLALNSVLDTSDVQSFVPLVPGVRLREPTLKGKTLRAGAAAASAAPSVGLRDGTLVVELAYDIGSNVEGGGGKAETQFELTPKGSADVDITSSGINTKFRLTAATRIETRFKMGALGEYDKEWTIGKIKGRCFNVQLGPVPVIICLEFDVKIRFEVDGSVGVTLAADYKREFGAELTTKNTTVTATKIDDGGSGQSDLRLYGDAQAKLLLPVECTLYFYGAAGPGIVARPYLHVKADTTQNPWWEVRAGAELGAFVKSKRFFGKEIDWRNDHLLNTFYTLKNSGGPFIGLKVTPARSKVQVNTPLDFDVSVTGYPLDTQVQWRVVEGPGTIDSDGRFTSDRNGVATVEAFSPADIFHPDLRARGSVVVGGGPPGAPAGVTATAGPLSATVTWTAAGDDGGHPVNGYVLTTFPPTATTRVEGSATTVRVRGLAPDVSYLIYVRATNDRGAGPPAVSNAVVPGESPVRIGYRTDVAVDELGKPDARSMAGVHGVAVSGNGRFAFFLVEAQSNLAPPEIATAGSAVQYLVRKDLTTGEIVLASRALDGRTPVTAGGFVRMPGSTSALPPGFASNADGSVVAYSTGTGFGSLYVHNIDTKATWNATAGLAADNYPGAPRLSDDGTVVAFAYGDITAHLYRRVAGGPAQQIDNCFLQSSCTAGARQVGWFSLSGSGTRIAYEDAAVVSGVAQRHALLWDASTGITTDLTPTPRAKEESWRPVLSGDGAKITFSYNDPGSTAAKKSGIVIKPVGSARVGVTDIVLPAPAGMQVAPNELSADGTTLSYSQGSELEVGYVYSAALGMSAKLGRPADDFGFYDLSFDLTSDGRMLLWSASYACDDDCGGGVWAQYFN